MKQFFFKLTFFVLLIFFGCKNDFEKINTNPKAVEASTAKVFNYGLQSLAKGLYNELTIGFISPWVQYIGFGKKYNGLRMGSDLLTSAISFWFIDYSTINQFKKIIELNEKKNPSIETETEIALSAFMMAYIFHIMTDMWGDIPYYSYFSRDDLDFQALNPEKYPAPKFVSQERIYKDLLKSLKEVYLILNKASGGIAFLGEEFIYNGSINKWKKLVNSFRLKVANRIKSKKIQEANSTMEELKNSTELILDNSENAIFRYGTKSVEAASIFKNLVERASPYYYDFKLSGTLVDLLKGEKAIGQRVNPFEGVVDPRLFYYGAPVGMKFQEILKADYLNQDLKAENFRGIYPTEDFSSDEYSNIGYEKLRPNATQCFLSAAEVYFILAENGDKNAYEKAIRASMEQWGVKPSLIEEYLNHPKIKLNGNEEQDKEKILTQEWIEFFMRPTEALAEIRKHMDPSTGRSFPKMLLKSGDEIFPGVIYKMDSYYEFDLVPSRLFYYESLSLNPNVDLSQNNLTNKMWWMKD